MSAPTSSDSAGATAPHAMGGRAVGGPSLEVSAERQRAIRIWVGALGVLAVGAWIGTASSLYLVNHHPLLLIALTPIYRHLILVAPVVNPSAFLAVAIGRRLLSCTLGFQLGRAVGEPGLVWLEQNSPRVSRWVRWIERLFVGWPRVAIVLLPGTVVTTLAGIAGIPLGVMLALATFGLALRMAAVLWLGQWLAEWIQPLLGWIDENWVVLTGALLAWLALREVYRRVRARSTSGTATDPAIASGTRVPGDPGGAAAP